MKLFNTYNIKTLSLSEIFFIKQDLKPNLQLIVSVKLCKLIKLSLILFLLVNS